MSRTLWEWCKSSRWKLEKTKGVTSSYSRKPPLDLIMVFWGSLLQLSGSSWLFSAALLHSDEKCRLRVSGSLVITPNIFFTSLTLTYTPSVYFCRCVFVLLCVSRQSAVRWKEIHPVGWLPCRGQTRRSTGNDLGRSLPLYQGTTSLFLWAGKAHSLFTPGATECIFCACLFSPKPAHLPPVHTMLIVENDWRLCTFYSQLQDCILPFWREATLLLSHQLSSFHLSPECLSYLLLLENTPNTNCVGSQDF